MRCHFHGLFAQRTLLVGISLVPRRNSQSYDLNQSTQGTKTIQRQKDTVHSSLECCESVRFIPDLSSQYFSALL